MIPDTVYLASDGLLHKIGITANEAEHRVRQLRSPLRQPVKLVDSWHMPHEAREFERLFKGCLTHRRCDKGVGDVERQIHATRVRSDGITETSVSAVSHRRTVESRSLSADNRS